MDVAKSSFSSSQGLGPVAGAQPNSSSSENRTRSPRRKQPIVYRPPRTLGGVFARVTRAYSVLAVGMIPLCGAVLGFWQTGEFKPLTAIFGLLTTIMLTLALSALGEYVDYWRSRWPEARHVEEPSLAGAALVARRYIGSGFVLGVGLILLCLGVVLALWFALLGGWPVLYFVGSSALLMTVYLLHPTRQSFLGWGIADIGIFAAYGPLCVAGSYYAQTGTLSELPFWFGVPLGLLALLVFYQYNFIHLRRDWVVRKRTLPVVLGYRHALNMGVILAVLAYIAILLVAALTAAPIGLVAGLATLPLVLGTYSHIRNTPPLLNERIDLYRSTVLATAWTGLIFCLIVWMDAVL